MCGEIHHSDELLRTGGDLAVSVHAERQSGVVSTAQLHAAGLGRGAIHRRVLNGRLHPYHRGVYTVGHRRLTFRGRLWAAVLACGGPDVAVISHRSAAAVWDLLPAPMGKIDVTTLGRSESTKALRVHRSRTILPLNDVVLQHPDGLPLTTPRRTLHDLARTVTPHRLERLTQRAEHLRLIPRATAELQITRSDLEERMLALIDKHDLPRPRTNIIVNGFEVDFYWPHARLIVETDGAATHLTPAAFEADRRRDAALLLAGYRVVRFTYRQVVEEPERVAAILRALL